MDILLKVKPRRENSVINEIKAHPRKFTKIKSLSKYIEKKNRKKHEHYVIVTIVPLLLNKQQADNLKRKYEQINNVIESSIIQTEEEDFKSNIIDKTCHFFFDVDSTLTEGPPGTIRHDVRSIFNKLKNAGFYIYLASGRSEPQLQEDMDELDVNPYGIAESGGIIIKGKANRKIMADNTEPNNAFAYMRRKYRNKIKEDVKQGPRVTEKIVLSTMTKRDFKKCVKKSKAKVEVHDSKTAYHISNKNINKGAAIHELARYLHWGDNDVIVAVGDSGLDVPMFEKAMVSFAVGNSSNDAKKAASVVLGRKFVDGVREMYDDWFKF